MAIGWPKALGAGFFALLLWCVAAPALAILPQAVESSAEPASPPQRIETRQAEGSDEAILGRIQGIFAALPAFGEVDVAVREGVVVLNGTVPSASDIDRAETIASRVSGVVTVENHLQRNLSVDEGLGSLGGLKDRFGDIIAILPLLALAAGVALLIAVIGYLIAGRRALWERITPNIFLSELIASAIRFVFVVGGVVVALDMLGASALLGAVLGGAGVLGIALGFAMRDTVENYVASLMLSLRQPFRANDLVVIDNQEGLVVRLTSRATILMTLDGNHLRIPNSTVFKSVILNYTRNPQRRFDFELGIDASDDPDAARQLGVGVLKGLDFVLTDPEPTARVEKVGDSNIVLSFLAWIDQTETDFYKARSRAIPAVKIALEKAGFALPEPIYRLRFDEVPPAIGKALPSMASMAGEPEKPDIVVSEELRDTEPETVVARMIDEERAKTPGARDLLDPARPVE